MLDLLIIVILLIVIMGYYWILHPIILKLIQIASRNINYNMFQNEFSENYYQMKKSFILIIPFAGKRKYILDKIKNLEYLIGQCIPPEKIKVLIVYSKYDNEILNELKKVISNTKYPDVYDIILDPERGGKIRALKESVAYIKNQLHGIDLVVITDDDTKISCHDILFSIKLIENNKKLGVVSLYPFYENTKYLNFLYKYKRKIHSLESTICNPATIGGELLVTRPELLEHLMEPSLVEDYQLNLLASSLGYFVVSYEGNTLSEKYPSTFKKAFLRTVRTIYGTYFELARYWKKLPSKCKYIQFAYMTGLLSLGITPLFIVFITILFFKDLIIFILPLVLFIILIENKLIAILLGSLYSLYLIMRRSERVDYEKLWPTEK